MSVEEPGNETQEELPGKPEIIERDYHTVSRKNIDQDALKVLHRLTGYGYQAFLVGGGVRDLLLGKIPKDFDIGTSARPEEVRELFRNSRIIGRRFKLVHIYFRGGKIIEVSTFRAAVDSEEDSTATLAHDNTYGDAETDALRRDLTINGLFYNADDFTVIDYVGGLSDLEKKVVRIIGDPDTRFTEDPVRIIRASRHAARADFSIESKTSAAMKRHVSLLHVVPSSRLYEEFLKDLYSGSLRKTFVRHRKYGVIGQIMPALEKVLADKTEDELFEFYERLESIDRLINAGKDPLTELLFSVFMIGMVPPLHEMNTNTHPRQWSVVEQLAFLCQENFQDALPEDPGSDDIEGDSGSSLPVFKLRPVKRERSRDRLTDLAKEIGKWFLPLTLTKREKMALERMLVIRKRVLSAAPEDVSNLTELLHSLHAEERENIVFLCELYKSKIPRGLRGVLGGQRKKSTRNRRRFYPGKKRGENKPNG
jgi:poly(A) polymerase